ncbi:TfoX/Sxy family protein [Massilia yuzhufengensis]|uniref:Transcriptional regulator of competence genes, TfoX/Sxy family n=1 Tax=Massilia yuzhufengensis TaxID=1164594 RepID=A0A1I1HHD2_9BURK|nr:TfoX/Sxy family protein [Massilia yuzhufengensis]SFC23135.1 Transcriptional regulator of competence genes, TfoX/Sxy family [Massilia yuzhufengensis]
MATDISFVEYVVETAGLGSRLTYKKLFGEFALYLDGKVVAFACDNSVFIKPSKAVTALAPDLPQGPPYPGAKDYPIADELLDDPAALRRLIVDTAELMPPPKEKKPKRTTTAG